LASAKVSWGGNFSRFTLDRLLEWQWGSPKEDHQIVLIDITDEDYRTLFDRKRPLNPKVIFALIRAAQQGGAKLIAVDISTEDWRDE
jgi:CHASE2 domain-containing sensor protein